MASASPEKGRSPSPKSRSKLAAKQVLIERLHRCFVYMSNFHEKESINEQLKPLQLQSHTGSLRFTLVLGAAVLIAVEDGCNGEGTVKGRESMR